MQDKYINPFTDFGFKKIFGEEPNKELLIDFLNQVLPQHHQIQDLTYQSTERLGVTQDSRKVIFDLYCTSQNGDRFIVEMQKAKQNYFKDRSIYYSTFPIQEQAQRGDWDFKLSAVYLVGILDFIFEEDKNAPEYFQKIQLKNQKDKVFYNKLTYIYLEMPKFKKTLDELETNFDKWLYVLKHLPEFEKRPAKLKEKMFKKLFEVAEIARFNQAELDIYEESLKVYRDLKNTLDTSFGEGKEEGFIEGEAKGRIEGKIEVAKNFIKLGFDNETIAKGTGLSLEEIEELRKEN
jgi:predicted transposase/invertase (TIGR01784 family)